jgi:hypothetical protein
MRQNEYAKRDRIEKSEARNMAVQTSTITIPKSDLPVLKAISELVKQEFDSLLSAMHDTKAVLSKGRFIHSIAEKTNTIDRAKISSILRVVFVLYAMKDRSGTSSKELAQQVSASYASSIPKENRPSVEGVEILTNRLIQLLSHDKTVAVTAKAFDVMTEHEHVFCGARIMSDIRPVFAGAVESAAAAVIIHNLQIGFHDSGSGEHKEFYVSLDIYDIQLFKALIERAERKTTALEAILKSAKLPYLEV